MPKHWRKDDVLLGNQTSVVWPASAAFIHLEDVAALEDAKNLRGGGGY
jgi:hypothetical protein